MPDTDRYRDKTIEELLAEIDAAWGRLMETMRAEPEERYGAAQDAASWTPLDHMAHITAWERSVLFPLMGRPRHEGLGVTDEEFSMGFDPLNELIRRQTAGQGYKDVMVSALREHQALVNMIDASSPEELWQPSRELCPDQREQHRELPFVVLLMSDTSEHYDEHRGYIEKILAG
ncbi:MAG TPA: ClbS/DfsB family four-helix bundle protein [Thermomicrobiales bacterium]|nr:ClbS/DfsB family four-helix bundle protein [Thermomicrobiales bacterium]